jgi:hypothetical protein
VARPEARIDLVELEKLCGMQCTDDEIAGFFGVSTRTIERRRKVAKFSDIMDQAKAKGGYLFADISSASPPTATSLPPSSSPRTCSGIETS